MAATEQAQAKRGRGKAPEAAAEPSPENATAPSYPSLHELRDEAKTIREEHGYGDPGRADGKLTSRMLTALEPLLHAPIDSRYIQHIKPTSGKPYESTGIRSVQVQVDRMNAIIGVGHWRKLLYYTDGGQVCRAHVVVGNDLALAKLTEDGQLLAGAADVIAAREGAGGHSHGSNRGDLFKGAETNALKRTIAQLGPGHEIYCFDYDEDVNPTAAKLEQPATAAAPAQQTLPVAADPAAELGEILATADDLKDLRAAVHKGMQIFDMTPAERLERFKANPTQEQLQQLLDRINVAIEARDAGQ